MTRAADVTVEGLDVAVYTIPTDQPEADGTMTWSRTTMVTVQARAGGQVGLGWTYAAAAAADDVPVYGSGGFTTYDDDTFRQQLRGWVEGDGIPRVKIKIGESWGTREDRDLARVRIARETIGDDVELFVDANGGAMVPDLSVPGHGITLAPSAERYRTR